MARSHTPIVALGAAAVLAVALAGSALGQSPSAPPPAAASAGPASPGASPVATAAAPVAVGAITWKAVTKGKELTNDPAVYAVGQLPDDRLVVLGSTSASSTGTAWVSADGSKWSRLKLKAPKGSFIDDVGIIGATVVMTGGASDGTGLAWTSADGSTWTDAVPMSGTVYSVAPTPSGLVGVGVDGAAATAWTTADGVTWQSVQLAPSGRALHVMHGANGTLVAAGAVTDTAGTDTPVVWSSLDGTTWTQTTLDGLTPGRWSLPAAASTPAGFVVSLSERGANGSIGHVWSSPDGSTWTETHADPAGSFSAAGSVGTDALLIGHGQVLRSPDGVTWTATGEPSFTGWTVRDVMQLADGRLFAAGDAGDAFGPAGSAMATWTGTGAPAP